MPDHNPGGDAAGPEGLVRSAMEREPDAAHSYVMHGEDGSHTSYHGKDGEVSGPHEHETLEALKSHMAKFLGDEGHEAERDGGMWED